MRLAMAQCCGATTFLAAPAPEAQGRPGADSVSDTIRSAPAPDKKGRLQAAPTPAPDTKICNFKL